MKAKSMMVVATASFVVATNAQAQTAQPAGTDRVAGVAAPAMDPTAYFPPDVVGLKRYRNMLNREIRRREAIARSGRRATRVTTNKVAPVATAAPDASKPFTPADLKRP